MLTDQQSLALQNWMRGSLGHAENPSTRYIEEAVNALIAMAKTVIVASELGASPSASTVVNTVAINAAVTATSAIGGGVVLIPPGTYIVNELTHKTNVIIAGLGPTISILKLANGANSAVILATSVNDCGLRDIGIDGNNVNQSSGDRRNVHFNNCNFITLKNVRINRNGDGTGGSPGVSDGLLIAGGSRHKLHDVEVFGDDMGTGIRIQSADTFELRNAYVRDINYELVSDPGDDRVEGIIFNGCSDFSVISPRVRDMGGDYGAGFETKYSRGITFAGCSDWTLINPQVDSLDQGIDVTGSAGNVRFDITGGMVTDCGAYGYKFANSARDGTVTGCVAVRCGFVGFIVSGPAESGLTVLSGDIEFVNCTAYDTGSNGVWSGSNIAGFGVFQSAFDTDTPRGVRFVGCRAHDRQGVATMKYGFFNQVAADADGRYNEAVDCISIGHTTTAFEGMNGPRCLVKRSSNQTITNNSWTSIDWDIETDDGQMHSLTSNTNLVFVRRSGNYRVQVGVVFAADATGVRGVRILKNGAEIPGAKAVLSPVSGTTTAINVSFSDKIVTGESYRVEVYQTSGGDLDITGTESAFVVEQVT